MSHREEAKNRRRNRILSAARQLMQQGEKGFSMRALADKSGVSIATPYNLFGSKHAILAAVMQQDVAESRCEEESAQDSLAVLFRQIELELDDIINNPGYYRAVFAAQAAQDDNQGLRLETPRQVHWLKLLQNAVDEKMLQPFTSARDLGALFQANVVVALKLWFASAISDEALHARCRFSLAVQLAGFSTAASRDRLQQVIVDAQTQLSAHRDTLDSEMQTTGATDDLRGPSTNAIEASNSQRPVNVSS